MDKFIDILILSQRPSDAIEMSRVATSLSNHKFVSHILIATTNQLIEKETIKYFENIIGVKSIINLPINKSKKSSYKFYVLRKIKNFINLICYWHKLYFKLPNFYKELITKNNIKAIIIPEDIVGYVTPLLIKAGNECNIPTIIIPYTIANQEEAISSLKNNKNFNMYNNLGNFITGKLFPSWVKKIDGKSIIRLPFPMVWGQFFTRTMPKDPWLMNSSNANIIAVESKMMYKYCKKSGIDENKLKILGACYDDVLYHYKTNKKQELLNICIKYSLEPTKKLLVIGGFPNQLSTNVPYCEFDNIESIVKFIASSLEVFKKNYNVIYRPHPNYINVGKIFEIKGIKSIEEDTAKLVAISDIYMAFASATIRWAIACHIPTINYDIFNYNYSDYNDIPGIFQVKNKNQFIETLNYLQDSSNLKQSKNEISKNNSHTIDGNSVNRISNAIKNLISNC